MTGWPRSPPRAVAPPRSRAPPPPPVPPLPPAPRPVPRPARDPAPERPPNPARTTANGVHDPIEGSLDACGGNGPIFRIRSDSSSSTASQSKSESSTSSSISSTSVPSSPRPRPPPRPLPGRARTRPMRSRSRLSPARSCRRGRCSCCGAHHPGRTDSGLVRWPGSTATAAAGPPGRRRRTTGHQQVVRQGARGELIGHGAGIWVHVDLSDGNPGEFSVLPKRRRWDLNPRLVAQHTISSRADSAALALLRDCSQVRLTAATDPQRRAGRRAAGTEGAGGRPQAPVVHRNVTFVELARRGSSGAGGPPKELEPR